MKFIKKISLICCFFLICLLLTVSFNSLIPKPIKPSRIETPNNADAPVVRGLVINDLDANLSWNKLELENDWCSGNGTMNNPYVIDNIMIRRESNGDDYGIYIHNSLAFFIIKNCDVGHDSHTGLFLWNVSNGIISYNQGDGVDKPIALANCSNVNISSNIFKMSYNFAIDIDNCKKITIYNNTFTDGTWHGISLYQCTNCFITENHIEVEQHGCVILSDSHYNIIHKNVIHYDKVGMQIFGSTYNNITYNYLDGNGECFDERFDSMNNIFEHNTCLAEELFIPGYDWFIILSVILIIQSLIVTNLRIKKRKII
jgi:parallel beta-helix repeat protein